MYRVLIVDDDKLARKGLISIVDWEKCGMQVVGDVSNGAIALEFLKTNPVDLVVVDLSMPVLSGLDFIRESKKLYEGIQYVVLSFHESFEYVQSALRLGALDYISKLRLDSEDCTGIFTRVAHLIRSVEPQKASTEEATQKLEEQLLALYWVYDDVLFRELQCSIADSGMSIRQLDRLMITVVNRLNTAFARSTKVMAFQNAEEGIAFLALVRREIYADCGKHQNSIESSILEAVRYIRENLCSEALKTESIAEQVNLSRGYLSLNFKKYVGSTINSFIREARVERAKEILAQGPIAVTDLAAEVGYRDEKYFANLFFSQVGLSCAEYRRQLATGG